MPIGESTDAIGGRVTRSLRKRLTSIDSEVSSRPDTPANINLQTISETNTPSKRLTRRVSLSTPSAATPSKIKNPLENIEASNTPGRRGTRRRSVNISEVEDRPRPMSIILKEATIDVVNEEGPEISKKNNNRVTRSSSKSPKEPESSKKQHKTFAKKTTTEENEEVINLDDSSEIQISATQSGTKKARVSIKKEKQVDEKEKPFSPKSVLQIENESTPKKKFSKFLDADKNFNKITDEQPILKDNELENMNENKLSGAVVFVTPAKSPAKQNPIQELKSPGTSKSESAKKDAQKKKNLSVVELSPAKQDSVQEPKGTGTPKSNKGSAQKKKSLVESSPAKQDPVEEAKSTETPTSNKGSVQKKKSLSVVESSPAKKDSVQEAKSTETPKSNKESAQKRKSICVVESSPANQDSLETFLSPEKSKSDKDSVEKNSQGKKSLSDVESSPLIFEEQEKSLAGNEKEPSLNLNVSQKDLNVHNKNISVQSPIKTLNASNSPKRGLHLSNKNQASPARSQTIQNISPKKNRPEQLKNVAFNDTADENTIKSVYPKTPGLTKSKSYILDSSSDEEEENKSFEFNKSKTVEGISKKSHKENIDEEEHEGLTTKTPYKLKLKAVESSTPLLKNSPKQDNTSEIKEQKSPSFKECVVSEEKVVTFPKSWTQSVSGTVLETSKIDRIASEKLSLRNSVQEGTNKSPSRSTPSQNCSKNKSCQLDSDNSEAEDDMLEEDDDDYGEEEERNEEKSIFLDDEAMEVAEGEESMDSEEREYLEQNEVPVYGESIGSQDTEEDDNYDEEADEEDAAFIVSDAEAIEDVIDDDSEKKLKKYKRICQASESSEDETNRVTNLDDTDLCLLLDSSSDEINVNKNKAVDETNMSSKSLPNDSAMESKVNEDREITETEDKTESPFKTSNSSRRMSSIQSNPEISECDVSKNNEKEPNILKSPEKKIIHKSPKQKSIIAKGAQDDREKEIQSNLIKVSRQSADDSENLEDLNVNSSSKPDNNMSVKEKKEISIKESPVNKSRKSLVRTSTEETNETEEQINLNNTVISLEGKDEPEETMSASEFPLDTSIAKSPKSKKNRKSNEPEISRRKSIINQEIVNEKLSEYSDSEENREEKTSSEITDDEMESSRNEPNEAQFSDEENVGKDTTILDFLGEEEITCSPSKPNSSRRKSVVNESKLDETFQMDPKCSLSSTLHDSLHRSILRKSLNQSQLRRETIEANRNDIDEEENASSDSEEGNTSSEKEEVEINKKVVSEKGLSVSLNSIQIKKKNLKDAKAIRNSFTIGVSVRKNYSDDEDSSEKEEDSENERPTDNKVASENEALSENEQLILSEEEALEKVKYVKHVGSYKSRKSMSNSILFAPTSESDMNQQKRIKRTSLYLQEQTASNSFVENLAEEKKKIRQQKRKSNSFCGVVAPSVEDDIQPAEPRSEKKLKKTSQSEEKGNLDHILSRCDQIVEAANQAKLEAKLKAKKVKVKKPKWMDREEKAQTKGDEVKIPLVSNKEIKRKEKVKKELAKAVKHSTAVLTKIIEPGIKSNKKNTLEDNNITSTKRLENEFLESLMELSLPKKKKSKIETTPPSNKENSKKRAKKAKNTIEDIADASNASKSEIETLETVCGTVIVEPSTPQKLRHQNGFRESPKTPVGFKIQDLGSTDKNLNKKALKSARKLITSSGSFVEEDLSKWKTNPAKQKSRKRKLHIHEPSYSLPKTQWTASGVFVEEDAHPLENSTATRFSVTTLNSGKTNKSPSTVVSSTTFSSALSFKQNALHGKVPRQSSRELLYCKHRKTTNKKF